MTDQQKMIPTASKIDDAKGFINLRSWAKRLLLSTIFFGFAASVFALHVDIVQSTANSATVRISWYEHRADDFPVEGFKLFASKTGYLPYQELGPRFWSEDACCYEQIVRIDKDATEVLFVITWEQGTPPPTYYFTWIAWNLGGEAAIGWHQQFTPTNPEPTPSPTPIPTITPTPTPYVSPTPSPTPPPTPSPTPPPTPSPIPAPTATPKPSATPTPTSTPSGIVNLSARAYVTVGDRVAIGGLIVRVKTTKVVLRGIGPSLTKASVTGALQDPVIELHGQNGSLIVANDNWRDSQATAIQGTGLTPSNVLESAIIATLPPGNYTVILRGKNGTIGVGLVEIFEL